MKLSHLPLRLTTGAFILNSGVGKLQIDGESAAGLQKMGASAFPQLADLDPEQFGKFLSAAEIALGTALLLPFVPSRLAGLGLTAFSASMVTMYLKTPGLTREDGIRPTSDGTAVAKDFWMLGIGLALVLDSAKKKRKAK
ncbi:hypothetical protein [Arthrobacter sp. JSM 101049]|uniref:hypothetical protein n=1 Tax=Arthrobacter sp. JSM 101049 TaxID=929097 RepID=UPI00356B5061